jgi:sialic acid synthase SpsE
VFAQQPVKRYYLTFKESSEQVSGFPTFLANYRTQRQTLKALTDTVAKNQGVASIPEFDRSIKELVQQYLKVKENRGSLGNIGLILLVAKHYPEDLLADGWSQKEVSTAVEWGDKYDALKKAIVKIDSSYPTDNEVEQTLIRAKVDIFFLAGVKPGFLFL